MLCFAAFLLIAFQTTKRNKADLDDLASRVRRLLEFLSLEPQPRDEVEAGRRTALTQCVFMPKSFSISNDTSSFRRLQDTSCRLMKMKGRRGFTFACKSMTQDIADCNTDIGRFLSEYAVALSFRKDFSRFLTMQNVSVVRSSMHQETAQADAGISA